MTTTEVETEQVQQIPVDLIDPSPRNPRKLFDSKRTAELAANIRIVGVLQPIEVVPEGKRFRITYGERRWRASKLAERETIPAFVRNVSPEEADARRHIENEHSEPLKPLERAKGYAELMRTHKLTVEQVAARINKSAATVRDILKLNSLIEPAKAALLDVEVSKDFTASHALWVAHVPSTLQKEVLEAALTGGENGGVLSVRALKDLVKRDYMLLLKGARFDPSDAQLVPKAGACGPCAWRSGNQGAETSGEVGGKDVCTNRPCFGEKLKAWLELQSKAGRAVLSADDVDEVFPYGGGRPDPQSKYVLADDRDVMEVGGETYRKKLGREAAQHVVLAPSPDGGVVELLPRSVLPKKVRPKSTERETKTAAEPELSDFDVIWNTAITTAVRAIEAAFRKDQDVAAVDVVRGLLKGTKVTPRITWREKKGELRGKGTSGREYDVRGKKGCHFAGQKAFAGSRAGAGMGGAGPFNTVDEAQVWCETQEAREHEPKVTKKARAA